MKIRISKKLHETFPKNVAHQIEATGREYNIKSFSLEEVPDTKAFFVAEGDRYVGVGPNGETAQFEVVNQNNIGAAGLSHKIGEQFHMPAGSYLLNVWYYSGYGMSVYHVIPKQMRIKA